MKKNPVFYGLIGLLFCASATASECKGVSSEYTYSSQPSLHAKISPVKINGGKTAVGVLLEDKEHHLKSWFLVDKGAGSYSSLISVPDFTAPGWKQPDPDGPRAIRDLPVFGWEQSLKMVDDFRTMNHAPEFLFIPELAEVVTHGIENSFPLSPGIFKRTECK